MIYGIGTDICDIRRVAKVYARQGERFAQHILSTEELVIWQARKNRNEQRGLSFLATRFSAKEAFSKAIGLGMHAPMTWRRCAILNAASGQPYIQLHEDLLTWFNARHLKAHITVSDEVHFCCSFVVVEK